MTEPVTSQPALVESPTVAPTAPAPAFPPGTSGVKARFQRIVNKVTTRHGWLGDYDFGWLCTPTLPYGGPSRKKLPPFYALDADIPMLLAIVCGFQHSLAMLAGLITPPIIFARCVVVPFDASYLERQCMTVRCSLTLLRLPI
jgi:uric acid-xanthine permease